jgi:hypothetical protein
MINLSLPPLSATDGRAPPPTRRVRHRDGALTVTIGLTVLSQYRPGRPGHWQNKSIMIINRSVTVVVWLEEPSSVSLGLGAVTECHSGSGFQ